MSKTNYIKKLSVASIGAIPKEFKKQPHDTRVALMHVFGRVDSMETGTSQFGPWVAFVGSFKAILLDGGEVFRSSKCLLPGLASDAVENAVQESGGNTVEFAIEIGVRRVVKLAPNGDEVGAGYEYTMKPLIEMDEATDPLAALESRVLALNPPPQSALPLDESAPVDADFEEVPEPAHETPKKSKK